MSHLTIYITDPKTNQQLSEPLTIDKGVPQGSVLAPTTFSVYINNIYQVICSQQTYIHLYRSRQPINTTVLPLFDYVMRCIEMHVKAFLEQLDVLYHAAIRLVTNAPNRTHYCELYFMHTRHTQSLV